jgi:hypothetical protein
MASGFKLPSPRNSGTCFRTEAVSEAGMLLKGKYFPPSHRRGRGRSRGVRERRRGVVMIAASVNGRRARPEWRKMRDAMTVNGGRLLKSKRDMLRIGIRVVKWYIECDDISRGVLNDIGRQYQKRGRAIDRQGFGF